MPLAPCLLLALLPACAARAAAPGLSRIDTTLTAQVDGVLDSALGKGGLVGSLLSRAPRSPALASLSVCFPRTIQGVLPLLSGVTLGGAELLVGHCKRS